MFDADENVMSTSPARERERVNDDDRTNKKWADQLVRIDRVHCRIHVVEGKG